MTGKEQQGRNGGTQAGTRERLIAAAEQELIEGHGHLEMQGVARRADVSVGLAYHHFGSKAGLIAAVVEAFYTQLDAVAFSNAARFKASDWAGRERERIGTVIAFHYSHPFSLLVLVGALSRAPEVLEVEAHFLQRQLADGARMLESAKRDGILAADLDAGLTIALMMGGIRQAVVGVLSKDDRPTAERLTDDIWRFISAALRLA